MDDKITQAIIAINKRLQALEEKLQQLEIPQVFPSAPPVSGVIPSSKSKALTLAELVRGHSFPNGQKRVAAIVGYYEKVEGRSEVATKDIELGWRNGKLNGSYNPIYLRRAVGDGLVRDLSGGKYDLSQSGESFFEELLKKSQGV